MARKRRGRTRERGRRQKGAALRVAVVISTLLGALIWAWFGPELRELTGLSGEGPPARDADSLRVVTWNLANFRGAASGHDLDRIRAVIDELDPDVLAVQEIKDPEALAALLPEWELVLSRAGGRGHQRLGVAYRPERVELLTSAEHSELSLRGRVRPAFSAHLRARGAQTGAGPGPDLWLVVVHLKAMPDSVGLRREQWQLLRALATGLTSDPEHPDGDLLIVGDFNTTGPPGSGPDGPRLEQAELAEVLAGAQLRRLSNATGCTAYYDGARRDAWKEPSEIDLVWARELAESLDPVTWVHAGTHCVASRCEDMRSTEAYPVRDYESVSDHCPVVVDLRLGDDD